MAPFLATVSSLASIISAIVLSHYDPLHSAAQPSGLEVMLSTCLPSKLVHAPELPSLIRHPSSALFAAACPIYALTTMSFYQLHKEDQHQNHYLTIGVILSLLSSLFLPTQISILQRLQTCVPFGVSLALLASAVMHRLLSYLRPDTSRPSEERIYPAEKSSSGI